MAVEVLGQQNIDDITIYTIKGDISSGLELKAYGGSLAIHIENFTIHIKRSDTNDLTWTAIPLENGESNIIGWPIVTLAEFDAISSPVNKQVVILNFYGTYVTLIYYSAISSWLTMLGVNFNDGRYGTGSAGTYSESFETGYGSWFSEDGLAWLVDENTPSADTGAIGGSDGVNFAYNEASDPYINGTFCLVCTDYDNLQSIEFKYHMYGADMGILYVEVYNGFNWITKHTISGQQQALQTDAWLTSPLIDVSDDFCGKVRFRMVSGTTFMSDCCIDEIELISIPS
jgi:hypothetical protein